VRSTAKHLGGAAAANPRANASAQLVPSRTPA
jgi:hypothetical protein